MEQGDARDPSDPQMVAMYESLQRVLADLEDIHADLGAFREELRGEFAGIKAELRKIRRTIDATRPLRG